MGLIKSYKDLRPKLDNFVFNDGSKHEYLCLDGTIPVTYKGSTYNIPVCMWLLDSHPYNPPMVYVKPTTTMQIKSSQHVDSIGKVYLPYLHEWKYPQSDLYGLTQILVIVFSESPPVFSRNAAPSRPPPPIHPGNSNLPYPAASATVRQSDDRMQADIASAVENKMQYRLWDRFLQSEYQHPDETMQDIRSLQCAYKDLRPKIEDLELSDGSKHQCLCLDGTIPVTYKGSLFNITVCIWLLDSHPYKAPIVYVKPDSSMRIKENQHVDSNGKVSLPYLHDWKYPESDLLSLTGIMATVFSETPPVFSRRT